MKHVIILLMVMAYTNVSYASDYYYTDGSKTVTAEQAITDSLTGQTVYQCKKVEAKVSKSGNSIGLHPIKKAKKQ